MSKEIPSFRQIEDQIPPAHVEQSYPTVLVDRSGEQVSTATYEGEYPGKPGYYLVGVDGGDKVRAVTADQLSDDYQAALAEKLAGKPLRTELGNAALELANQHAAPVFIDRIPEDILAPHIDQPVAEERPTLEQEIARVDERIKTLLDGLSDDDKNSLFRYMLYKNDKINAQQRGDGEASTLYGQYMGQEERAMSPRAQQVANEYHQLMNNLSSLRDS